MKKMIFGFILTFSLLHLFALTPQANADPGEHNGAAKSGIVFVRGVVNLGTFLLEIPRTTVSEIRIHPKIWPLTFLPRAVANMFLRIASGLTDFIFYPLSAPFYDDVIDPLTRHMGLPDYAWQFDEDEES